MKQLTPHHNPTQHLPGMHKYWKPQTVDLVGHRRITELDQPTCILHAVHLGTQRGFRVENSVFVTAVFLGNNLAPARGGGDIAAFILRFNTNRFCLLFV